MAYRYLSRPAKFVSLNGQIVVCGINTRNLDKVRDRCEMHLHMETGGVFVHLNGEETYLSPTAIAHVDIDTEAEEGGKEEVPDFLGELERWKEARINAEQQRIRLDVPPEVDEAVNEAETQEKPFSREDEILAEIGHTIKAQDEAKAQAKGRRKKK